MTSLEDLVIFPPDSFCFLAHRMGQYGVEGCPVLDPLPISQSMLAFLNLTSDASLYRQAYCVAPPTDDNCVFGYCPNGDIAGPLVRAATYVTNLCLSILVFYSPKGAKSAFWSQVLSIYAVLITCGIAILQASLTRFHAAIAVVLTGSPLSLYLFVYSVMSLWYRRHRLNGIVGDGQILPRTLILIAGALWTSMFIYVLSSGHVSHFAQESCTHQVPLSKSLWLFPIIFVAGLRKEYWLFFPIVGIFSLIVLSWIIAIILQRKTIWPPDERWQPRFGRTWSVMGRNYPFIHFISIVAIPTIYWMMTVELACLIAGSDQEFSLSFGQVMAAFVALQPLIGTLMLYPRFFRWFVDLTCVRAVCCCQCRRRQRAETGDAVALETMANPSTGHDMNENVKSQAATSIYKDSGPYSYALSSEVTQ
ncbi:hypothetical protein QCA50_013299 [Cerrena zonata]|uniref:G-protein coupled receptors family 2 profile 2 domain-containing protein n=1 Tax=Cerrena zonata TaxID=2478898 RepID=A0AAW0FX44_9APHY